MFLLDPGFYARDRNILPPQNLISFVSKRMKDLVNVSAAFEVFQNCLANNIFGQIKMKLNKYEEIPNKGVQCQFRLLFCKVFFFLPTTV